nr:hypothetical protein [Tanacetum cinerariifolium]
MGYSFYYPPENKLLISQNVEFLKNSLITQEASGSLEDLEIIQEEDTHPFIDTSLNHEEDDLEIDEPQSDIRAIRILIAIAAYYDYEIWQMDVKTAFLNGYLSEEVYMEQPGGEAAYILGIKIYRDRSRRLIGLCQSAYIEKILKRYHMENSKRGSIPMQDKLKLSKSQGASTPAELKCMKVSQEYSRYVSCLQRKFIYGLGVVPIIEEPISMYCDNTGAITIANESGITKGARHFRAKVHYLREVIEYGDVKLEKFHIDDNLADPFTKELAFPKHLEHTKNIGMLLARSLM